MGLKTIFRAMLLDDLAAGEVDQYALRNRKTPAPSPGQMGFSFDDEPSGGGNPKWDEKAHPRAPKAAPGSHGGEFVKRGLATPELFPTEGKRFQPALFDDDESAAKRSGLKDFPIHESDRDQLMADLENAEGMGGWAHAKKIRAELDAKHPGWDDEAMGREVKPEGHGKTYDVNGQGFNSFKEATVHAHSIGADVTETATGTRRWTPAPPVDPKKQRQYNERKAAYDAQVKLNEQQEAERKARHIEAMAPKPSGIQMPTRSNDEAKAGDQLGLFGEASRPKRESSPMLAPGGESKGRARALFDTHGPANQMDLFGDGFMSPDLVAKESRPGFQSMLLGDGAQKKTGEPVAKLEPIAFRDRRSFADKMAADGKSHSEIVEAMQSRGVAAADARRHAANALGDKAQGEGSFAKPPEGQGKAIEQSKLAELAKKPKPTPRESAIRKAIEANGGHDKNSADDVDKIRDSLYYNEDARQDGSPPKHTDIRAVVEQMKAEAGQKFEKSAAGKRAADPRYSDPMSITPERSSGASLTDHDSALVDLQDAHERLEKAKKAKADDYTLKLESPGSDRHSRASAAHDKAIADAEKAKARAFTKFVPHAERLTERNKGFEPKLLEEPAPQAEAAPAKPAEPTIDELAKSAVEAGGSIWKHAKEKIGRGLVEMSAEERKAYAEAAQRHSEAKREAEKPAVSPARAAAQKKFLELRDREAADEKAASEQPASAAESDDKPNPELEEKRRQLRILRNLDQSKIDNYKPDLAVAKVGKKWVVADVHGKDFPTMFSTRKAAVEMGASHHKLMRDVHSHPENYADLEAMKASAVLDKMAEYPGHGASEIERHKWATEQVESRLKAPTIEPHKKPSPAKPSAPRKPRAARPNKHGIEDFGEKIGGARKDTATPIGPRNKVKNDEDVEAANQPGWRRRYRVAEDANKQGEYFIADTRTNTPHFDEPVGSSGSYSSILSKYLGKSGKNFTSKEAAEKHIAQIEAHRNHGIQNLGNSDNPNYAIYRKVSDRKRPVVRSGFKSYEEAAEHLKANPEAIIEHEFPHYESYQYLDKVERTGKEYRKGDAKPKDFQEAFNFRGGEFGKWQMNKDGQMSLNHAYDALHDLADVLGVPPRAMSLNGDLAIGFGSRGTGGKDSARAHYEPDARVINLTKMKGAGTLAHEWLHALDHHLMKVAGAHGNTTTGLKRPNDWRDVRPELAEAIKGVHDAIAAKSVTSAITAPKKVVSDRLAKEREETRKRSLEYGIEIPFPDTVEDHVYNIRKALDRWAEYKNKKPDPKLLKEYDELGKKISAGDIGEPTYVNNGRSQFGGYQTFENVEKLNQLHKKLAGRGFHTKDDHSLGTKLYWHIKRDKLAEERIKAAKAGQTQTSKAKTDFLRESMELDKAQKKDYYSLPEEMFARAFEAYLHDKLESRGQKSQYLGAKAHNKYYAHANMKPFPEGEERQTINAAFDHLFKTLKHQSRKDERGDHVNLYSTIAEAGHSVVRNAAAASSYRGYAVHRPDQRQQVH